MAGDEMSGRTLDAAKGFTAVWFDIPASLASRSMGHDRPCFLREALIALSTEINLWTSFLLFSRCSNSTNRRGTLATLRNKFVILFMV